MAFNTDYHLIHTATPWQWYHYYLSSPDTGAYCVPSTVLISSSQPPCEVTLLLSSFYRVDTEFVCVPTMAHLAWPPFKPRWPGSPELIHIHIPGPPLGEAASAFTVSLHSLTSEKRLKPFLFSPPILSNDTNISYLRPWDSQVGCFGPILPFSFLQFPQPHKDCLIT